MTTKKEHAVQKLSEGADLVYDAESGEQIEVTQGMRRTEEMIRAMVHMKSFEMAALMGFIKKEKLYLAAGCANLSEYARDYLPFSKSQTYIFSMISNKLAGFLPEISVDGDKFQTSGKKGAAENLEQLGISKLYALAQLKSEDIDALVSGQDIVDAEGNAISLDDIREMTAREAQSEVKKVRDKYSGKISTLEEKLNKALSEKKAAEAEIIERDERIERARELERMFGKGASKIEDKYYLIADAKKHIEMAQLAAVKSKLENTDPLGVQKEMASVIRLMDEYRERLKLLFGFVVEAVEYE